MITLANGNYVKDGQFYGDFGYFDLPAQTVENLEAVARADGHQIPADTTGGKAVSKWLAKVQKQSQKHWVAGGLTHEYEPPAFALPRGYKSAA